MATSPLISAIIPVYNQANWVLSAIQSVREQTWQPIELILINDGSTDDLEEKLSQIDPPDLYLKQSNCGAAAARNQGIEKAKGKYLTFLDADDRWPQNRTETLLNYMEKRNPSIILGKVREPNQKEIWLPSFGAALFKKEVFETVGLLDESLTFSEDQDWFLRAKEQEVPILAVNNVSLDRSLNPSSLTYNRTWNELDIHRVLKRSLDRRRKTGQTVPKLSSYGEENV